MTTLPDDSLQKSYRRVSSFSQSKRIPSRRRPFTEAGTPTWNAPWSRVPTHIKRHFVPEQEASIVAMKRHV